MKSKKTLLALAVTFAFGSALLCVSSVQATVVIDTVPIGNAGNADDTEGAGYGGVDYTYNIGKYEVTAGQYAEFLNAVAATDTYGLYAAKMNSDSRGCQITQNGISGSYTYDFSGRPSGTEADWVDRPVNYLSWGSAARFSNWLHNGQPTGAQGLSTTEDGAYFLNGAVTDAPLTAVTRESDWTWAIPTEDEWYKAAYHKNDGVTGNYYDYPTSSDSEPANELIDPDPGNNATYHDGAFTIGNPYKRTEAGEHENSESPYDTFDQGGNSHEWNEAVIAVIGQGDHRGLRGGSYTHPSSWMLASTSFSFFPTYNNGDWGGFRVVQVPEPASLTLILLGGGVVLLRRRRSVRS